jgi:hypothetical protein
MPSTLITTEMSRHTLRKQSVIRATGRAPEMQSDLSACSSAKTSQKNETRAKRVFVLGVYASAVHALDG